MPTIIKLITKHRDHVARVNLPEGVERPEIIVWSGRAFVRPLEFDSGRVPEYTEHTTVVITDAGERPSYQGAKP